MPFDPTATHPLYDEFSPSWRMMRDCVDGEDKIKEKGEAYLPIKSGTLAMEEPYRTKAYEAYKLRAEFPELVAPTIRGSVGTMLDQEPEIKLPTVLEPLIENATRDGMTLQTLFRRICIEIMTTGRFGILPGLTDSVVPYLATYVTEAVRNWDTDDEQNLNFLMLDESRYKFDRDTGKWTMEYRFRELYIDGGYNSRVWVSKDGKTGWTIEVDSQRQATFAPRNGQRAPVSEIPFVFVNTNELTPDPDDVPLYGLGKLALRIYRMDADYTFALHMTSEPTPWVNGFNGDEPIDEEDEEGNKVSLVPNTLGSSRIWILPEGAQAGFLEFSGAGISAQQKAIEDSLKRAVLFGANMLSDGARANESGDALALRLGNQTSTLKTIVQTAAAGLEKSLKNLAVWLGANPDEVSVKPNTDFYDQTLDPQEIMAIVQGWQADAYSKPTMFERLKRGKVIPMERTFEEEEALIEANPVSFPMPPMPENNSEEPDNSDDE